MDKFTDFLKACKMLQPRRFWALLAVVTYLGTIYAPVVTAAAAAMLK